MSRLDYRTLPPDPRLARQIECYWFLAGRPGPGAEPERVLPDGCVEIVLNLADPLRQVQAGAREEPRGSPVVAGQLERHILLAAAGRLDVLGVRFHPAGARPFLRVPIHELTGRVASLDDLRPDLANDLRGRVADARGPVARARILDRALSATPGRYDRLVEDVVAAMVRADGAVSVSDLAARAGLSGRQLERRFRDAVGLGPKRLARILRLHRVLEAVETSPRPATWAAVAAACHFADQSHLIRDFRHFTGETPPAFLAAGEELTRHLSRAGRMSHSSKTTRLP